MCWDEGIGVPTTRDFVSSRSVVVVFWLVAGAVAVSLMHSRSLENMMIYEISYHRDHQTSFIIYVDSVP